MPLRKSFRRISSATLRACPLGPANLRFSTAVESSSAGMRSRWRRPYSSSRWQRVWRCGRRAGSGNRSLPPSQRRARFIFAYVLRSQSWVSRISPRRPDTAWISTALSEMLTTALAAGEQLRTVPEDTVARTKLDLGLSDVESLSPDALTQVRKNLASDFVVLGSYLDLGKKREAKFASTFDSKTRPKEKRSPPFRKRARRETMIDLASQAGARLRQQFGLEKLSQLESEGVRAEVPSNPEAMRPYAQGLASIQGL